MTLYIRMALYAAFAGLAGAGIGSLDLATGLYCVPIDKLASIAAPAVGFVLTFASSRWAKARGWAT